MAAPFANGTEGDMFLANRCHRCVRWDEEFDGPCEDFTPAYLAEWPGILYRVPTTEANPLGVECRKFEVAS